MPNDLPQWAASLVGCDGWTSPAFLAGYSEAAIVKSAQADVYVWVQGVGWGWEYDGMDKHVCITCGTAKSPQSALDAANALIRAMEGER